MDSATVSSTLAPSVIELSCDASGVKVDCGDACTLAELEGKRIYLSGYVIGATPLQLLKDLDETGEVLNRLDGHFSGVLITPHGEVILFCDRFGAKSWYFHQTANQIKCSTSWQSLPSAAWQKEGVLECVHFRWLSGHFTLFDKVHKLPPYHLGLIKNSQCQTVQFSQYPKQNTNLSLDIEQAKNITREYLKQSFTRAESDNKSAAVLLSGGVDSAILAALATEHYDQVVAYTPVFTSGENPELETAKVFADTLKIEHKLIEIDEDKLVSDFEHLIAMQGAPLRHYSSLVVHALLRQVQEEYVLYGEAADTLFGSNAVKRVEIHHNWKQQAQWIPSQLLSLAGKLFPRAKIMQELKQQTDASLLLNMTRLRYSPQANHIIDKIAQYQELGLEPWHPVHMACEGDMAHKAKQVAFTVEVPQHFKEIELSAETFGKKIISPFQQAQLQSLSASLSPALYFGEEYVKPILRELACETFPRERIYQRKWGFPVPALNWLKGPFHAKVEALTQAIPELKNLSLEEDFEAFWLLLNLRELELLTGMSFTNHDGR